MKHYKWIYIFFLLAIQPVFPFQADSLIVVSPDNSLKNGQEAASGMSIEPAMGKIPLSLSSLLTPVHSNLYPEGIKPVDIPVYNPLKNDINYTMLGGMGALFLGVGTYIHIYQQNAWWKDQRTNFHFHNDWDYSLWIDKIGHFYGTNILAHAFSAGYDAANMTAEQSAIFSASSALLFELYVETEDGFASEWGFSPGDATGDFLGAAFYLGQYYYPFLKNFQPKWSYWPTNKMRTNPNQIIIDDYEGQIYWMSMRVNNFLPERAEKFWPDFLNIAVGMGVKQLDGSGGGYRELYISLDLDAEELPLYGPVWQFVKNSLNYFHLPMPGIRVTPNAAFFVFCY